MLKGYTSELVLNVAVIDIETAINGLAYLVRHQPRVIRYRDKVLDWAASVCGYTRYVHLNTWADGEPVGRVKDEFLPEFEEAETKLGKLLANRFKYGLAPQEVGRLEKYQRNVFLRKENLRERYCRGLESSFPPGEIHPDRLAPYRLVRSKED